MKRILSITRKELAAYFGSPMAAIFIGAFLLAALFSFFWLETFFARNTADIRPLFRWMPVLMIFLVSALTMRQWSEEQKMGTLEVLLTMPVKLSHLVLGKFFAVLALVAVSLALTLGLPLTVSLLGNLDWGPVAGGYLGALLMASAYIGVGLFVSSRTDNQIIALILSVLVCGVLYIVGSTGITTFMGDNVQEILRALGTGSRFESVERGVIDLRDVVYYVSLAGVFLALNILSLDSKRWSDGKNTAVYRRNAVIGVILIVLNLVAVNFWLYSAGQVRLDLTEQQEYSISDPTRDLLGGLREPLLLRGYFSEKTHPLLAPLVPRIKDMLTEYGIASGGRVTVEFVDPKFDEEKEIEANQQYGIKPVPFQVAGRYEASVVNSYFNILIKYGDQHVTLGFGDLIEIDQRKDGGLEVGLRNLEYDLTKSIKKAVYGFQSIASVFDGVSGDIGLVLVATPGSLPEEVKDVPATIRKVVADLTKESGGKLGFTEIDPKADGLKADIVTQQYGIEPLTTSLFGGEAFYLHLLLRVGDGLERVYLGGDFSEAEIRNEIEAVLKRTSSGFLKTVGYWTPAPEQSPQEAMYQQQPEGSRYTLFQQALRENYNVKQVDLASGQVPGDIDVLLLVAPQDLSDLDRFAVDQYLMRGGSVVALAGRHLLDLTPYSQTLNIKTAADGLADLFAHYGISVGDSMVLDAQNEPFPVPVERNLGGLMIREIRQMPYPFFVDVRSDGMDQGNPMTSSLPAVTLHWVSPLSVDPAKNVNRQIVTLLASSEDSWLDSSAAIQPDFDRYPGTGFAVGDPIGRQTLAVAVKGSFSSYFADRPDPRVAAKKNEADKEQGVSAEEEEGGKAGKNQPLETLIAASPDSSRLVLVGSSEFINDTVIGISRSLGQDRYLNSMEFLQNTIDWSVEDEDLLSIRSRGSHARLLVPMTLNQQRFWEWVNYGLAFLALTVVSVAGILVRRREKPMVLAG